MSDTQTKILEAASALFLEGGLSALSVRAIAARAGVSTIGIYSYFQGKQGILDTLYIESAGLVSKAVTEPAQHENLTDAIVDGVNRYLGIAENYPAHYALFFGGADAEYTPSAEAYAAGGEAFEGLVTLTSRALPDNATLAEKHKFAVSIWALTHGFVGLRSNAVNRRIETKDWRAMVLDAVAVHIRAYVGVA